jgi:hypothetical protein
MVVGDGYDIELKLIFYIHHNAMRMEEFARVTKCNGVADDADVIATAPTSLLLMSLIKDDGYIWNAVLWQL